LFPLGKKIIGDAVWVDSMQAAGIRMGYRRRATTAFTFTGANLSELDRGGESEQAKWSREPGAPPVWMRKPVSFWHRLKKGFAGAYRLRSFRYAVFTLTSPDKRAIQQAHRISGGWPGQTSA